MIVIGNLSEIGSSRMFKGFYLVTHLGFNDRDDIIIDQRTPIGIPTYLYDKLSTELGNDVELSMTDNKRLVLAVRTAAGKVYKYDAPTDGVCRANCRPMFVNLLSVALVVATFFTFGISLILWYLLRRHTCNGLLAVANAFDGSTRERTESDRLFAYLDREPDLGRWEQSERDRAAANAVVMKMAVAKLASNYDFAKGAAKDALTRDPACILAYVRHAPHLAWAVISQLPELTRDDDKLMHEALSIGGDPKVLEFASPRLKNDRAFMSKCIEIAPGAYQYASPALRADRELAEFLFTRPDGGKHFEHAAANLLAQKDLAMAAFRSVLPSTSPAIYELLEEALQNDAEIVAIAKEKSDWACGRHPLLAYTEAELADIKI